MKYQIVFTPEFEADIEAKVAWLEEQHAAQHTINNWFAKLYQRMWGVEDMPRLYPVDEKYTEEVGRESHKIIFREHLAIYQVDDKNKRIEFVAFHHGSTRG